MGGYRYHKTNGSIDKNKHSHVAEALQYLMLHIGNIAYEIDLNKKRDIKQVAAIGWT